ncbi:MAG: C10 family peptidase [Bacteroidales bacterium]|nr:C10 family peptidase [Bacteroidales bacterium]
MNNHTPGTRDVSVRSTSFYKNGEDTVMLITNFNKGFMVLAADDAVSPVLAYSLDESMDLADMAPAARAWLDQYAQEIALVRSNPERSVHPDWNVLKNGIAVKGDSNEIVSPLLTAKWNQTKYYNKYSPVEDSVPSAYGHRTPNGCVAVAMAMIMYYYRYPMHGYGSHTNHTDYGDFYVNFSQQHYCYEAMEDALSSPNDEVAKLIFHCATSVDMMYGATGSGAYSFNVPDAMKTYFGYSPNTSIVSRYSYSSSQWKQMLKTELNNGRPVYYSGHSSDGGHAFVCDGYDANNLFHFNFGWGGSSNGYYTLSSSESPSAVGGFYHSQQIVVNCYPGDSDYPYYCLDKLVKCSRGTIEDGSGPLPYQNNTHCMMAITDDYVEYINISLQMMDTEDGHDTLSFWDGHPSNGRLLQSFSGQLPLQKNYSFQTDTLYVTFNTNDSDTGQGWRFEYEVVNYTYYCNYEMYRTHQGTITDGSGSLYYQPNSYCVWRIWPNHAQYIILSFSELDINPSDALYVYDVKSQNSKLVAAYSGNQIPSPLTVNTSKLMVVLETDNYLNAGGFTLSWITDSVFSSIQEPDGDIVTIYPNPVSNQLHVSMPLGSQKVDMQIYDLSGKLVRKMSSLSERECVMDVSSLSSGIYILKVCDGRNVYRRKIVVER